MLENWYRQNGTLTIDDYGKRTWIDQVRPSDKNVKGINQVIARIAQLFPKAVRASRYCDIRKKQIPVLKGIGILGATRPSLDETRPIPAPLPAPETQSQQATRPTRPTFSNFAENNGEGAMQIELLSPPVLKIKNIHLNSGAGGAEPLQDKGNWGGKWGETGAGQLRTGAGNAQAEDFEPLNEPISLLQAEKEGEIFLYIFGFQVEVRSHITGSVKFFGEMINYDIKNGFVTVATEQGEPRCILPRGVCDWLSFVNHCAS